MQGADIRTRIALEGAADIIAQLKNLAAEGEKTIKSLGTASAGTGGAGLAQIGAAVTQLTEASATSGGLLAKLGTTLNGVGGAAREAGHEIEPLARGIESLASFDLVRIATSFGALPAAIGLVAAAFVGLSENAARATDEIEDQAATLGLSVEKFETLRLAAATTGTEQEKFTGLMERFTAAVGRARNTQDQMAQSAVAMADKVKSVQDTIANSMNEAAIATQRAVISQQEAALSIKGADASAVGARKSLKDLQDEYNAFKMPDPSQVSPAVFAAAAKQLDDLKDRVKLAEDAVAAADARAVIVREQAIAAANAARAATEKRRIENDKLADSLKNVAEKEATAEEQDRLLAASLLTPTGGAGADVEGQLKQLADRIVAMKDETEQANAARAVFGRGWAEIMPLLRLGGDGIQALTDKYKEMVAAVSATEPEKKMANDFLASFSTMSVAVEGLKNAIGNILGVGLVPLFDGISAAIKDNIGAIRDFAAAFGATFGRIVFVGVEAVRIAFFALAKVIGGVAQVLNDFFGTKLETASMLGVIVGLAAGFVAFKGAVLLAEAAIWGFARAYVALTLLRNPWLLLAVGLAGLTGAMVAAKAPAGLLGYIWDELIKKGEKLIGLTKDVADVPAAEASTSAAPAADTGQVLGMNPPDTRPLAPTYYSTGSSRTDNTGGGGSSEVVRYNYAEGGQISGPGGRDRVPIMATAGEFMVQLDAVRHYGLGALHALNSMRLPKFDLGGLIAAFDIGPVHPVQHFAGGGLVAAAAGGRVSVDLTHNGKRFPVISSREVADKLVEHARGEQMQSAGKKPGWYGG